MKKIILIVATILIVISCSNNQNNNSVPEDLLASWRLIGYYNDFDIDQNGSNFQSIENGEIINFHRNNTFDLLLDSVNYNGSYAVSSDSIITKSYNQTAPENPINDTGKINLLTTTILEIRSNTSVDFTESEIYRFEKVTTP